MRWRKRVRSNCVGIHLAGTARSFAIQKSGREGPGAYAVSNRTKRALQRYLEREARMTFPGKVLKNRSLLIATRAET